MRLCKPDSARWWQHRGYTKHAAAKLTEIMRTLTGFSSTQPGLTAIYGQLLPFTVRGMCHEQRIRLDLLLGMSCVAGAGGGLAEALDWLNEGIDLAFQRDDLSALPYLFYLHGIAHTWRLANRGARDDFRSCLGALHRLKLEAAQVDAELEQAAWVRLADAEFLCERYELAEEHYDEAEALARLAPERPDELATVLWGKALLYRWQLRAPIALAHAMEALSLTRALGNDHDSFNGRLQVNIAEIALDLAEAAAARGETQRQEHYLTRAMPYARRAITLTGRAGDLNGQHVARLAAVRCATAMRLNVPRERRIKGVLAFSQRVSDSALEVQAFTTLGREYLAQEYDGLAQSCFTRALDAREGPDIPAIGFWAYRAVRRALITAAIQ